MTLTRGSLASVCNLLPATMPELWKPSHIHAVLTPSEIKLTQESIEILEVQLQNAMAALQSAQHAVTTLQRQIDERRSWIAPIRRITHDVGSMIFLELCRIDRLAPIVLGSVCRGWRESILASPRAWTYFQLTTSQSYKCQSLFLSRSAPCHLHLHLPCRLNSHAFRLLASVAERIKCLSLDITQISFLQDNRFPALKSLTLRGAASSCPETNFILNSDLFPSLRSLDANLFFEEIMWRTPPFSRFIPLQALSINVENPQVWSMIVENCRESLTSLSVTLHSVDAPISDRKVILLPHLKYLSIVDGSLEPPIPWVIDARTPALQVYSERSWTEDFVGPIHNDTKTVIYLIRDGDIDLSKFPQVRQMRFDAPDLANVMGRLMEAPEICPNLETIVVPRLGGDLLMNANELIAARNRQTGGNIQFGKGRDNGVYSYRGWIPPNVRLSPFFRLVFLIFCWIPVRI
jgi:hypothetical protein